MKQAIAGVSPSQLGEATVMTVWPSIARFQLGRTLGQLMANKSGAYIFTVGNLMALLSIPVALALYFYRIAPVVGLRYRLTNKRIVVHAG
ncbi:MAG TPA: PH domain-containing protein, partial [Pirellulaceae bacterium]|nr:PH domain-containing protein [Pirellulaceae bacterium]